MKTHRITYLAAALTLLIAGGSCEHDEIYEPLEFAVQLSPTNTYKAGDPVVFNFSGNADFITIWNGDTGHDTNIGTVPYWTNPSCSKPAN